jgi:hypothetical protein
LGLKSWMDAGTASAAASGIAWNLASGMASGTASAVQVVQGAGGEGGGGGSGWGRYRKCQGELDALDAVGFVMEIHFHGGALEWACLGHIGALGACCRVGSRSQWSHLIRVQMESTQRQAISDMCDK